MAIIGKTPPLPGIRSGLARTGAGPELPLIGDAGAPESGTPSADAGKEVTLVESSEIVRSNIDN
jgi:hypothetical protein